MNRGDVAEQQTRGLRARELLENEVLKEALDGLEKEVVQMWGDCPMRDQEGKEALWQLYKTTQKFRALLMGYIEAGKFATEQLKRHEKEGKLRGLLRRA